MATPTYAEVLTQINTYIVANGNNDITANILNPILELMTDFTNNTIGDLDDLTTDEIDNIVVAINSLKTNFDDLVNNGVQLYTGIDDPNVTPPPTYNYADFYMQLDVDDLPVKLWQWDGFVWTDESLFPVIESDNVVNNSIVPGLNVTVALNYLFSNFSSVPIGLELTADGVGTIYDIGTTALARMVFWGGVPMVKADWVQSGSDITFSFVIPSGTLIQII